MVPEIGHIAGVSLGVVGRTRALPPELAAASLERLSKLQARQRPREGQGAFARRMGVKDPKTWLRWRAGEPIPERSFAKAMANLDASERAQTVTRRTEPAPAPPALSAHAATPQEPTMHRALLQAIAVKLSEEQAYDVYTYAYTKYGRRGLRPSGHNEHAG